MAQGSLLISKLEFFIKADFRGLGFFISRPYAVFYTMKIVFYKRVHILFISIIFEAKTVILPNAILYQPKYWNILKYIPSQMKACTSF